MSPAAEPDAQSYAEAIIRAAQNPLVVLDADLRVERASPAFCDRFKMRREDCEGRLIFDLGNGQWDIPRLRVLLEEILPKAESVEDFRVECEFERIGHRVMLLQADRIRIGGSPDRILLAIHDITDQERTRRELQAQRDFAEKIVNASREAVLILNPDLCVKSANQSFYDLFKVRKEESEGCLVYDLGNGQWDIPELRRLLENVLPDNDAFDDYEIDHDFEQVGRRIMMLNARRLDRLQLILLAIEDVTDRRRSQRALRESESRYRTLVEGIPQLVWRADNGGKWTWANPQWRAHTGLGAEESTGLGWLEAVHPDDREAARAAWRQAGRGGETLEMETRLHNAARGDYAWFRTRAAPLRDERGRIVEWLGTSTDVDELRHLQEQQSVLVAELQHRTRNLIAVVQSIASQTQRGSATLEAFGSRFRERLAALARVQGLLSRADVAPVDIGDIIRSEIEALGLDGENDRIVLAGPRILIRNSVVQTLSLAIHELATNARKFGALSSGSGRLSVRWERIADTRGDPWMRMEWRESGMDSKKKMASSASSGYGRTMLERALPHAVGARTVYDLGGTELRCLIEIPLRRRQRNED